MSRISSIGRTLVVVGALLPAASQSAEVTVKLAFAPTGDHVYTHMSDLMKAEIEKRVPGKVDWQVFPGSQLGRDDVVLAGIKAGTHIAGMSASWMAAIEPGFNVFEAPFLFTTRDQAKKVIRAVEKQFTESLAKQGFVLLGGIGELGFRQITNSTRPIVKPEDLKGIKLRVPGTPMRVEMFKLYGASPSPMNFAEVYMALRQGVMDGQENPMATIWAGKFYEVQKFVSMSNHVFTPTTTFVSKKHWDTWPADVRKAIEEAGLLANEFSFKFGEEADKKLQAQILKEAPGVKFNDIDTAAFKKVSEPLYAQLEKEVGKDLWAKVMAAVK